MHGPLLPAACCTRTRFSSLAGHLCLFMLCQTDGTTPLFSASHSGHAEVVVALLAAGASVDAATVCTEHVAIIYLLFSSQ